MHGKGLKKNWWITKQIIIDEQRTHVWIRDRHDSNEEDSYYTQTEIAESIGNEFKASTSSVVRIKKQRSLIEVPNNSNKKNWSNTS